MPRRGDDPWPDVPDIRRRTMSAIRHKNTRPELAVRSLLHRLGYRYRLHGTRLPGRPDLVFASRRKVIFVHGCYWHGHPGCRLAKVPKTRTEYWQPKLNRNKARDIEVRLKLRELAWDELVIWECEITNDLNLAERLISFLGPPRFSTGSAPARK